MVEETKAVGTPKTQEQLNVEYYGRIYESFLKKAEELGKERSWTPENVMSAAETMFYQYQDDQVALAKDGKMHRLVGPLLERLQQLPGMRL
jgi:hypothetical protein